MKAEDRDKVVYWALELASSRLSSEMNPDDPTADASIEWAENELDRAIHVAAGPRVPPVPGHGQGALSAQEQARSSHPSSRPTPWMEHPDSGSRHLREPACEATGCIRVSKGD
jgi:hypothetical protein